MRGLNGEASLATWRTRAVAFAVILLVAPVLVESLETSRAEAAVTSKCGTVVRGYPDGLGGREFTKATVLIVHGADSISCRKARKLAWKAMGLGGICEFGGCGLQGWQCQSNGIGRIKCIRENPRRVVKTVGVKPCERCRANRN